MLDEIVGQLGLPAQVDADGDWRLDTEAGEFLLATGDAGELLALQTIRDVDGAIAAHADLMYLLLQLNLDAEGACFAALADGDADLLVLVARVEAAAVTRASVERMLADAIRLSRRLDELAGTAPAS